MEKCGTMSFQRLTPSDVLAWGAAFIPLGAFFSPLSMAPVAGSLGLLVLLVHSNRSTLRAAIPWRLAGLLAIIHLWQLVTVAWAIDPPQALRSIAQITALSVSGVVLLAVASQQTAAQAERIVRFGAWGVGIALATISFDLLAGGWVRSQWIMWQTGQVISPETFLPQRFNRALTVGLLLMFPIAAGQWLCGRKRIAAALAALAVIASVLGVSLTAKIVVLGGALCVLAGMFWWRRLAPLAGIVCAAIVLVSPNLAARFPPPQELWAAAPWLPGSAHHRATIWHFTAERIAERPVQGWGMEASRVIPGGEVELFSIAPSHTVAFGEQVMPLHPHNMGLQWRLELGLPGVALLAALIMWTSLQVRLCPNSIIGALGIGLLFSVFVVAEFSFGSWQSWWLGSIWITVALGRLASVLGQEIIKPAER